MTARTGLALTVVACTAAAAPATATADPYAIGGWIGPRFYSDDSALGYIDTAPDHPALTNGMVLGFRVSRPILAWLVPELELPFGLTTTDRLDASVLWLEPRLHARFEFLPDNKRIQPFVLIGGGAPITWSSKSKIFGNDIVGDGYFGIGAHAITGRGFQIRGDFRISLGPGVDKRAVLEFEAGIGIWVELGAGKKRYQYHPPDEEAKPDPDPDRDGVIGDADACPDRAEDEDGYDDRDGCPDIDNDLDHVLDIADKCASVSETINGFDDDDGCPDSIPPELDELDGTIEGLTYDPSETSLGSAGRKTLKKIAAVMKKYPTVRVKLIGYTDSREAIPKHPPPDGEQTDALQQAIVLSLERAGVIKAVLIGLGVDDSRISVEGKGWDDPVGDNEKKRGRLANRRVVLKRIYMIQ